MICDPDCRLERFRRDGGTQTDHAWQFVTEMVISSLGRRNPMAISPRRIVTDMLLMPALQIGNPIEAFIQMIIYNLAGGACLRCGGFHA